jgi:RHS repeat-associated protein
LRTGPSRQQPRQYNGFNQLLSVSSTDGSATSFAYDGNGNQVSKTDSSGITQYVYDLDNRLRGIALAGGGANAFEYDANGLRTRKMDSTGTRSFLLDGLSVVAEYQGASRSAFYAQSLARIDEVLSVVNAQGKYWYESDALGSTYALCSRSGAAVARTGYDAFGAVTASYGTVSQPWGFTGRELDGDSGLEYFRDRFADALTARWTQPDRLRLREGPNRFRFLRANPVRYADPSGQKIGRVAPELEATITLLRTKVPQGAFLWDVAENAAIVFNFIAIQGPLLLPLKLQPGWFEVATGRVGGGGHEGALPCGEGYFADVQVGLIRFSRQLLYAAK